MANEARTKQSANSIIKALMHRDNMTLEEATSLFEQVRDEIHDVIADGGSYDEVEDIMYCELGLEMDYIYDILG